MKSRRGWSGEATVTARHFGPMSLVAALLIVVGLASSAPPTYGTTSGDHFGLLLHPIFLHSHGDGHTSSNHARELPPEAEAVTMLDGEQSPSIQSQPVENGGRVMVGGMVPPLALRTPTLNVMWQHHELAWLLQQDGYAPLTPPPRQGPALL